MQPGHCFEDKLEAKYELKKGGRLRPGLTDAKESTILIRVVRYADRGIEYEADPRQCERLLERLGLDVGCKSTATPGPKLLIEHLKKDNKLQDLTGFWALSAS